MASVYPFRYTALNARDLEFRLVTIHPGPPDSPIICSLSHQSLQLQLPAYEVLSCTSGQGLADWKIVVDGQNYGVKEHVAAAFRALRYQAKPRTIWAEAVCVNTLDADERSSQLQLRNQICQRAGSVVVWLGPGTIKTHETFRVIERHIESATSSAVDGVDWDDAYGHAIVTNISEEILNRKWWSWAAGVQDVTVSSNVIIKCGSLTLTWPVFVGLVQWLRGQQVEFNRLLSSKFLDTTNSIKAMYDSGARQPLCQLLLRLCHYESSDFREKVSVAFGVRERVPNQLAPLVSYSRTISDILVDVADACIRFDHSLDFLSLSGLGESNIGNCSWQPELLHAQPAWRTRSILAESSYSHLVEPTLSLASSSFSAAGRSSAQANISRLADKWVLTATGILIDQIEIVPISSLGRSTPSLLRTWEIVLSYAFATMEAFQSLTDRWSARMQPRVLNPGSKKAQYVPCKVDGNMEHCELRQELFRKARDKLLKGIPNYNLRRTRPHYPTPAAFQNAYFRTILTDRNANRERVNAAYLRACMLPLTEGDERSAMTLNEVVSHVAPQHRVAVFEANFLAAVEASLQFRTLFVTKSGYIGLGPTTMQPNDTVAVLFGYSVPVVLRKQSTGNFVLIGECYLHGIMDGEAVGTGEVLNFTIM